MLTFLGAAAVLRSVLSMSCCKSFTPILALRSPPRFWCSRALSALAGCGYTYVLASRSCHDVLDLDPSDVQRLPPNGSASNHAVIRSQDRPEELCATPEDLLPHFSTRMGPVSSLNPTISFLYDQLYRPPPPNTQIRTKEGLSGILLGLILGGAGTCARRRGLLNTPPLASPTASQRMPQRGTRH